MNTGFLSNPAPSNGYDAVMAALAPHSAPRENSLGSTNPTVHNRVKQTFINPVATYPFIAAAWREGWEQMLHEGDLIFIHTKSRVERRKSVILANLPILNAIMAGASDGISDAMKDPKSWTFIGVMRNSAVASNMQSKKRDSRGSCRYPAERIINVDVRGATRMFNYWQDAKSGEHLYLAWVRTNKFDRNEVVSNNRPSQLQRNQPTRDKKKTCWTLLPYYKSSEKFVETWKNHTCKPRNTITDIHPMIPVGFVYQGLGEGEKVTDTVAVVKATSQGASRFKLPLIHAFLKV